MGCGVWSVECGVRSAECAVWSVKYERCVVPWRLWFCVLCLAHTWIVGLAKAVTLTSLPHWFRGKADPVAESSFWVFIYNLAFAVDRCQAVLTVFGDSLDAPFITGPKGRTWKVSTQTNPYEVVAMSISTQCKLIRNV